MCTALAVTTSRTSQQAWRHQYLIKVYSLRQSQVVQGRSCRLISVTPQAISPPDSCTMKPLLPPFQFPLRTHGDEPVFVIARLTNWQMVKRIHWETFLLAKAKRADRGEAGAVQARQEVEEGCSQGGREGDRDGRMGNRESVAYVCEGLVS